MRVQSHLLCVVFLSREMYTDRPSHDSLKIPPVANQISALWVNPFGLVIQLPTGIEEDKDENNHVVLEERLDVPGCEGSPALEDDEEHVDAKTKPCHPLVRFEGKHVL